MSYTAIVFDQQSRSRVLQRARAMGMLAGMDKMHCHHVTLAMGDQSARFKVGEKRTVRATHYGWTSGRVCAFLVAGAGDSDNSKPHVTVATNSAAGAKPRESNDIIGWVPLAVSFELTGEIEVCK